jgi:hypothetical protein
MSEVKRYDIAEYGCGMDEMVDGQWVSAADFDRVTSDLEQRRHAEQQACQAAERRVEELEELLGTSRVYITDLASSLENACEFFEGNEEDDPQATEECDEARAFAMRINAALNPTAEAKSP